MADTQHKIARKLLEVIASEFQKGSSDLSYQTVAGRIGRPSSHARAVAQACDLLDAAAALAGVPLLALVAVRDSTGGINRNAWKYDYGPRRDAILDRSLSHTFTRDDFAAIRAAIRDLGTRGNKKAWGYVNDLYPGDLLFLRLTQSYSVPHSDAINDLGTDEPQQFEFTGKTYARDPAVRAAVLVRANGHCEFCGEAGFPKPDGTRYLECHHIIALAKDGADRLSNVIAVCPNDHRKAHFAKDSEEIEQKMIQIVKNLN